MFYNYVAYSAVHLSLWDHSSFCGWRLANIIAPFLSQISLQEMIFSTRILSWPAMCPWQDFSLYWLFAVSFPQMYFHTGVEEVILFSQWKTTSWQGECASGASLPACQSFFNHAFYFCHTGMLGSCFAVFFMAALYEGLKVGREILLQRSLSRKYTVSIPGEETQAMTGHREQVTTR